MTRSRQAEVVAAPSKLCFTPITVNERDAIYAIRALRALADGSARVLRVKSGLSQRDEGAILGVSHGAISHYEAGRRKPRGRIAVRLGRLLERLEAEHGVSEAP